MEKTTITLSQEELALLHTALCEQRRQVSTLINGLAQHSLNTDEAQVLWNRLGKLAARICQEMHD